MRQRSTWWETMPRKPTWRRPTANQSKARRPGTLMRLAHSSSTLSSTGAYTCDKRRLCGRQIFCPAFGVSQERFSACPAAFGEYLGQHEADPQDIGGVCFADVLWKALFKSGT